jgi:hypothetical protein
VAGHPGRTVRADAEAQQIAAEFGLGRHVKVWRRGSKVIDRVVLFGFLIGLPVIAALLLVEAHEQVAWFEVPYFTAFGVVMSLPVVIGLRSWPVLHEFEAGVANVSRYRRRVSVVRWADLSSVREDLWQDEDGVVRSSGYVLQDRAGNTVKLGKRAPELAARAEQILAARLSRPAH